MHLQLCIFHFNLSIVNYTSASPWRKEVGCQGDAKGEKKERNFYQTKELQETDTTSLEAIPSPLNIFFCTQTYQNPNKGHFSQLKYEPSANLTSTREKYNNLADAKQITLNSEKILELCKAKNQEPPLRVVAAPQCPARCSAKQESCLHSWQELFMENESTQDTKPFQASPEGLWRTVQLCRCPPGSFTVPSALLLGL